ncbi:MAG TPA: CaiB/BaiF CoA-transferase family protein [Acidimicrobiia bacterium]|nr:CaiB/BaiF CoA-transferase family protein [Acidimicrobiia bacterium]
MSGPLASVRVVEVGSIGPGPFAAMVLADLGAAVTRVERKGGGSVPVAHDVMLRGRSDSLALDLKEPAGLEVLLRLVEESDILIEGFRPGVMERLGAGPQACLERNPGLVYGRITGWGQDGPRAMEAGHDIDYIALAGALHPIGEPDSPPPPPLNLIADFGGGGMLLVAGVLAALVERETSGKGQVVDAAMVDGSALLTTMFHGLAASGLWAEDRSSNLLDGGAPFYRCYRTADDRFVAVGALEPQFYAALLDGLGLGGEDLPSQYDRSGWTVLEGRLAEVFGSRTRDEWAEAFAGTDACVAPVLTLSEAASDTHAAARTAFVEVGGVVQPAPAPRFSRSAVGMPSAPRPSGGDAGGVLARLGYDDVEIEALLEGPVG